MLRTEGLLAGQLSGSLGGITASRNASGAYFRMKSNPVNPNSPLQQAVRNRFSALAELWSNTLTPTNRASWRLYASSVTLKNALGQDIHVSGLNMFERTNTIRIGAALGVLANAPTTFTLGGKDPSMSAVVDQAGQELAVAFDDTLDWLDQDFGAMQISMSQPVSAGKFYIPQTNRVAGYILGDSTTPPTTPQAIAVPFAVTEGQQVLVTGRVLEGDGRLSDKFHATSVVVA